MVVTGATGFLGGAVLRHLLAHTDAHVLALTRPRAGTSPGQRLHEAAPPLPSHGPDRLLAVAADLSRPRFGLSPREFDGLADVASCVLHLGAGVNGSYPYDVLRPANVLGTQHVVEFAAAACARLVYASSVSAIPPGGSSPLREDAPLGRPRALASGYAQTKWVAEMLVDYAAGKGLPAVIARIGALAGDSASGISNAQDYRWLRIRACVAIGAAPLIRGSVAWTPVDDVAAALVALARTRAPRRRYHLIAAEAVPWLEVFSWLRRYGFLLRSLDVPLWRARLARLPAGLARVAVVEGSDERDGPRATSLSSSQSAAALAADGVRLRSLDRTLVHRYLDAGIARGELISPAQAGGTVRSLSMPESLSRERPEPGLRLAECVSGTPGASLAEFAARHGAEIDASLRQAGAVRFRGFRVAGTGDFQDAVDVLIPRTTPYLEAATPRSALGRDVFTSTEFPASETIALHNENSYAHTWPGRLLFGCFTAPASGGATPLADVRSVLARLSAAVTEAFAARGWMLVRTYGTGFGLPWQTAFGTGSKTDVASYCEAADIGYEWLDGDRLRTRQVRPAIAQHPQTGERVWFNHICFWHASALDPEMRDMMTEEFGEEGLPYSTWYGDGQQIPDEVAAEIRRAYQAETISRPWRPGDVILLDNMLVAHGREPYTGDRRVVVSMGQPCDWTTCMPAGD